MLNVVFELLTLQ